MAGGHAACRRDRGGGRIQAPRIHRPRLIRAASSLACAGALAAYPAEESTRLAWLQTGIGAAGIVALAAGLASRRSPFLVWGLVLIGAEYASWLELGTHALDQRAPIVGGALLLTAELAFDSLEPEVGRPERNAVLGRAIALAVVVLVAVGAGAIVLAAASVPLSGGIGLTAVGAAAVVAVLGVIARLAADRE